MAAVYDGYVYTSQDGGMTWATSTAPAAYWYGTVSSADGTKLVASSACDSTCATYDGQIYISNNGGMTWATSTAPAAHWYGIASSADGTKLAAASYGDPNSNPDYLYTSQDGGMTWATSTAPAGYWAGIASSADGTKLVAAEQYDASFSNPGYIYISNNGGLTWATSTAPLMYWAGVASSADGTKLVAASVCDGTCVTYDGTIWTSDDGGTTWIEQTSPGQGYWYGDNSLTSSADGTKLGALAYYDPNRNPDYIWTATLSPTLTTSAASAVYDTGVTLNGSISDVGNDTPTTRGFVYGPTTSYGATTTENGSFGTGAFTATLSGLTCNSGYHYAGYADNGYLGYSSDSVVGTGGCPTSSSSGGGGGGGGGGGIFVPYIPPNQKTSTTPTTTPITAPQTPGTQSPGALAACVRERP